MMKNQITKYTIHNVHKNYLKVNISEASDEKENNVVLMNLIR